MRPASLYRAKLYKSVEAWVLPTTTLIVILQLLAYVAQILTEDEYLKTFWASRDVIPQVWRVFTYGFVHGSLMHVISNVAMTLVLAPTLEFIHGPYVVLFVWVSGVIGGGIAHVSVNDTIAVVGSSAGVYAILVARIYDVLQNRENMRTWPLQLLTLFGLGLPGLVDWITTEALTTTSHSAHLGGAAFGIIASTLSIRDIRWRRDEVLPWLHRPLSPAPHETHDRSKFDVVPVAVPVAVVVPTAPPSKKKKNQQTLTARTAHVGPTLPPRRDPIG